MASTSSSQKEQEDELKEAGNSLLRPPSSVDELLNLLDKVESLLSMVWQAPSKSMLDALLPSMNALIADQLLRHSDIDVKVSVVSCITEITRITAPQEPYNDEKMKEIFQLTVMAFEKLSYVPGRCHSKALQILETFAKVRSCLSMLDLECDALVVEMFQQFLRIIRSNHPHAVFTDMETIMTMVIEESEEVSFDLLHPLLSSVKKENQNVSPLSWKLGERVLENCAAKLKLYLPDAVKSMSLDVNEYAQIVASICQDAPGREHMADKEVPPNADSLPEICPSNSAMGDGPSETRNNDAMDDDIASKTLERCHQTKQHKRTDARKDFQPETFDATKAVQPETEAAVPKKRGRKPNSLIKPEEGYNHSWISGGNRSLEVSCHTNHLEKKVGSSAKSPVSKELALPSDPEKETKTCVIPPKTSLGESMSASLSQNHSTPDGSHRRRGRPKKKENMVSQDVGLDMPSVPVQDLVRTRGKGKASWSADVGLGKESGNTRDLIAKPRNGSRKNERAAKTNMKTTLSLNDAVVKREEGFLTDPEGKKESSIHYHKKQRKGKTASEKHVKEESGDKKMVFQSATKFLDRDENQLGETSKTKYKRKQSPRKEEDSKMSHLIKDYDEELVGCRIKVWWPLDRKFYDGVISSFDPVKKKHQVLYADGEEEILNLSRERWKLVEEMSEDRGGDLRDSTRQEQETELPRPAALSVMNPSSSELSAH
ncbi:unnamed protein product [Ilex paraguariensis]|uniref:Uncharacterized protein n=1 Tax=Ilex paraguariensis TaxID=185542 RepID=A0ABC8V0F3_9AQUA